MTKDKLSCEAYFLLMGNKKSAEWRLHDQMVPSRGIEPPTYSLPWSCSTPELRRQLNTIIVKLLKTASIISMKMMKIYENMKNEG